MATTTGFVTTPDGARLWYSTFGEGTGVPCVLGDGLGCDGFAWKYLAPALARTHRVLRFHYRGHGLSTLARDPARMGVVFAADDLAQIMEETGFPPAVLFGHSMGVQVILETHRRHPSRVRGIVPLCGSFGHPLDTFHDDTVLKRALPYLREVVERFPSQIDWVWKRILPTRFALTVGHYTESNPALLAASDFWPYYTHLAGLEPRVFLRTLVNAQEHTAWDHLPQVNVPVLVIGAEHDKFTPVWLSERMAAAIPGAELMVIATASHCAPLEAPELIELRVERFFRERFPAPAEAPPVAQSA